MLISSIDSRLVYRNAMKAFAQNKIPISKDNLSNAYLRFEVPINSQQTAYDVPITITQQAVGTTIQSSTEQRLELQDSFFISHMGYFFNYASSSTGWTGFQDALFTFPSSSLNIAFDIDRLQLFWNGFMRLTVNNKVICPQWDLRRHYVAPEGQRPFYRPSDQPWNFTDQQDGSQDGFYPVEPNWVLIGSRNNQMQVNFPRPFDSNIFLDATGSFSAKMVVMVRGVLAQNSTPVR